MTTTYILIAIAAVIFLYLISIYNRFVSLRNNTEKAWSNIDLLLKQRHEELPNLVAACKEYMNHESTLFKEVTDLRMQAETARKSQNVEEISKSENALNLAVNGLLARAEAYPDLKSSANFQQLMGRVSVIEDTITDKREFYNDSATILNTRRDQFPAMIVASMFGFTAKSLYEVEESKKGNVDLKSLFDKT